jgi:hypothetical protein
MIELSRFREPVPPMKPSMAFTAPGSARSIKAPSEVSYATQPGTHRQKKSHKPADVGIVEGHTNSPDLKDRRSAN